MAVTRRLALRLRNALLIFCTCIAAATAAATGPVHVLLPPHQLSPHDVAIIVNDLDPLSVRIGAYYQQARGIPAQNLIHVAFRPARSVLPAQEFQRIKAQVDERTPGSVQAFALTWTAPWRVDCMSITSAFAFGYDPKFCSSRRCARTHPNPWFNRSTNAPWTEFGIRPAVAVAAESFEAAKALIDRGIASDNSRPDGTAYLVITGDKARDVRSRNFAVIQNRMRNWIRTEIARRPGLKDEDDILFYFTGAIHVPFLDTLQFVPGAIADHLTSTGGRLSGGSQMSALRWLEAGATGSYGTVVEPCNVPGKFPDPGLVMESYGAGRTLLEAYWQSVQQPGEGIFIGEPLAAPFGGHEVTVRQNDVLLRTRTLLPGRYRLSISATPVGPYREAGLLQAGLHQEEFILPRLDAAYYRLEAAAPRAP